MNKELEERELEIGDFVVDTEGNVYRTIGYINEFILVQSNRDYKLYDLFSKEDLTIVWGDYEFHKLFKIK